MMSAREWARLAKARGHLAAAKAWEAKADEEERNRKVPIDGKTLGAGPD